MPPTSVEKESWKGTISTLSPFQTWLPLGEEKSRCQVFKKARAIWTWRSGVDPTELCLYEKPQKVSFMITALRERRWGWVLWRPCQSAALGSLQVRFHNNSKSRPYWEVVATNCLAEVCTKPASAFHFFTCSTKLYTIENLKESCDF